MRRILLIIAVIIIVLGLAAGAYYFFFAASAPHLTTSNTNAFGDTNSGTAAQTASSSPVGVAAQGAGTVVAPNLIEISANPVAVGLAAFDVQASSTLTSSSTTEARIRYIDRQSGNIYEYGATSRSLTRISDKTLPGIQQASWLSDGSLAFVQFLAQANQTPLLDTYALPASGDGGYFLQQNLSQATVIDTSTLLTVAAGTDTSIATLANSDGSAAHTLFSSPLTELSVQGARGTYVATTKAAATMDGYAFSVHSGSLTPILGPLQGLTSLLSPSGKELLYSYTDGTTYHMGVLNITTGVATAVPIATIAQKCVWTSDSSQIYCAIPTSFAGTLPDDWYQGTVSFADRIWKLDLTTRLATLVFDPSTVTAVPQGFDAISLAIDPKNQILTFVNKKDYTLWAYSL